MPYNRVHPTSDDLRDILARLQAKYLFPMSAVEYTRLVRRELPDGQTVSDTTVRKYLLEIGSCYRPLEQGERTPDMVGPDPRVFHQPEYYREPRDVELLRVLFEEPVSEPRVVATSDDEEPDGTSLADLTAKVDLLMTHNVLLMAKLDKVLTELGVS